ncbi:3370_t:CDS:2, partial [Paraglomus occultum]
FGTRPATYYITTTQADSAEKNATKWWLERTLKPIDNEKLPIVVATGVTWKLFAKRAEKAKARRFWDFSNGTVTIIELPTSGHEGTARKFGYMFMEAFRNASRQDRVDDLGSKSLYTNLQTNKYEEPDTCFMPRRLLNPQNPTRYPCDHEGTPWPTIIVEVAFSETLEHVREKINNYWLAPNRAEDVIVIKLGSWKEKRHDRNGNPLRRLLCQKFCRRATLQQNPNATTFEPVQEIEFGSIYRNGRPAVISSLPFPPQTPVPLSVPGVAIDLYDIQELIFFYMGPN